MPARIAGGGKQQREHRLAQDFEKDMQRRPAVPSRQLVWALGQEARRSFRCGETLRREGRGRTRPAHFGQIQPGFDHPLILT